MPIEWLERNGYKPVSWNPMHGCSPISEGCAHCWAKRLADTRLKGKAGYNNETPFAVELDYSKLDQYIDVKKPHSIFVVSMGDLFHDSVPDSFIASIFSRVILSPQHLYFFLTKRSARMARFIKTNYGNGYLNDFRHIWFGVTAENQKRFDERMADLFGLKLNNAFVSLEPLLGDIQINTYANNISWVIVGGESGKDCRPMDSNWVRRIRDDCKYHKIPFYFKQIGGYPDQRERGGAILDGKSYKEVPTC